MEVHAAEHHKKEDEQADQQHLQVAGEDQPADNTMITFH